MLKTLPNAVTIARGLAGPLGAFALLTSAGSESEPSAVTWGLISLAVFVIAALSDALDGWLARALNAESALGALLDPIADKLLVGAYLIAFVIVSGFDFWLSLPVAIIVLRDIAVTGVRLITAAPAALTVTSEAKIKTAIQMGVTAAPFALVLLGFHDPGVWFYYWVGAVWFAALYTAWTAAPYLRAALTRPR